MATRAKVPHPQYYRCNGMPVEAMTTPGNGDERQQVMPMLAQIRLATGKRGNPKRLE